MPQKRSTRLLSVNGPRPTTTVGRGASATRRHAIWAALGITLMLIGASEPVCSQPIRKSDREHVRAMLSSIKGDVSKVYYDPTFKGLDVDRRFDAAEASLEKASSLSHAFGIVAQALLDLDDSHTFFLPPSRTTRVEYGWQMQMVGDTCLVIAVKPGSDAEAKGLKAGDEVYSVDDYGPTRENFWRLKYLYYTLRPRPTVRMQLRSPDGSQRHLDVATSMQQKQRIVDLTKAENISQLIQEAESEARLHRHRYYELDDDLFIWQMPRFDLEEGEVDDWMEKVARHKALILDLRGNSGGAERTLQRLVGHFFQRDVAIGDLKLRTETKTLLAKTRGQRAFQGKLVVLVDSQSASAAEIFARLIQLERRGSVIGDRTAGAVMRSRYHPYRLGYDQAIFYGASITEADIVMPDGKSLEKVGVTADELLVPTAADLAAKRDPLLAHAAALLGKVLEPEKAGSLFPIEWQK